jgi:hypothetical protein
MANLNWGRLSPTATLNKLTKIMLRAALSCGLIAAGSAQTVSITPAAGTYVNSGSVPAPIRGLLANFGEDVRQEWR